MDQKPPEVIDAEFRVIAPAWRFPWKTSLWWLYCTVVAGFATANIPEQPLIAVMIASMAWPVAAFAKALAGPLRPAEEAEILKAQLSARQAPSRRR